MNIFKTAYWSLYLVSNLPEIYQTLSWFIKSPAPPVIFLQDVESQEAEEGSSVTLHCKLSRPGLSVEWKKGSQVLSCGEKYQMNQTGFSYELQIFDLRPEDTGSYSCSSEDAISSASLTVNGRMETHHFMLSFPAMNSFISSYLSVFISFLHPHSQLCTVDKTIFGYFFSFLSSSSYFHKRAGESNNKGRGQCHSVLWAL